VLWQVYGLVLLLGMLWSVPAIGLFVSLAARRREPGRRLRRLILPLEMFFCLVDPLAYLVIFVRSSGDGDFFANVRPTWLDPLAWALLLTLWSLRLVPIAEPEHRRRWTRAALLAGLGLLAAYTGKDASTAWAQPAQVSSVHDGNTLLFCVFYLLSIVALYAVPGAILVRYLKVAWSPQRWSSSSSAGRSAVSARRSKPR
jgi:hypothetical protein